MFGLYQILIYSGFSLNRFVSLYYHCDFHWTI